MIMFILGFLSAIVILGLWFGLAIYFGKGMYKE